MGKLIPALQIVHITDLHLCAGYSDRGKIAKERRLFGIQLRKLVEKKNLFGWHEGTLEHDETCEASFERFLRDLRARAPSWFEGGAETWLVDTGDLTTYGDEGSMQVAHKKLAHWQSILGAKSRLLFGNHDAWPGSQPAMLRHDWEQRIQLQQTQIGEFTPWRCETWLTPLSLNIAQDMRIELYGLDTVTYDLWGGIVALGYIRPETLSALKERASTRLAGFEGRAYRIVATHHPVRFPYTKEEQRVFSKLPYFLPAMQLKNDADVVEFLRNDQRRSQRSPSISTRTSSPLRSYASRLSRSSSRRERKGRRQGRTIQRSRFSSWAAPQC